MKQIQQKTLYDITKDVDNLIDSTDFNYGFNSKSQINSYNPSNGRIITSFPELDIQAVDTIVKKAKDAFEAGVWSRADPLYRREVLLKFANLIKENDYQLALLDTIDSGMPLKNSFFMELPFTIRCVTWYAELIDKIYGETINIKTKQFATVTREPIGVVAAIIAWNAPLMLAMTKIVPALAAGNSIILKPSEHASLSLIKLYELARKSGFPEGAFNIVTGTGEMVGKFLGLHNEIDCLTFVGSTQIGKKFLEYSGSSNMKKVILECGGKSASIIYKDCYDLDQSILSTLESSLFNQGTVCMASSRILVEQNIYDIVIKKILEYVKSYQPCNPLELTSNMGPMINKAHLNKVLKYIKLGIKENATLVHGGNQALSNTGGYFIEPTIFINVNNNMTIAQEEIFGPVVSIIPFENEECIKISNNTKYGLASVIWTKDLSKANMTAKRINCGLIRINTIESGGLQTPFGGYKESGIGRDRGIYAFHEYTQIKSTVFALT